MWTMRGDGTTAEKFTANKNLHMRQLEMIMVL